MKYEQRRRDSYKINYVSRSAVTIYLSLAYTQFYDVHDRWSESDVMKWSPRLIPPLVDKLLACTLWCEYMDYAKNDTLFPGLVR